MWNDIRKYLTFFINLKVFKNQKMVIITLKY